MSPLLEHQITPISRSAPETVQRPVMLQHWTDVVFLHWPIPSEEVQELLPDRVEVDMFDGNAWVGLVPLSMEGLSRARRGR